MTNKKQRLQKAQEKFAAEVAGNAAFKAGKKCIPCLDNNWRALLVGKQIGEGLHISRAWINGWHVANLNASN